MENNDNGSNGDNYWRRSYPCARKRNARRRKQGVNIDIAKENRKEKQRANELSSVSLSLGMASNSPPLPPSSSTIPPTFLSLLQPPWLGQNWMTSPVPQTPGASSSSSQYLRVQSNPYLPRPLLPSTSTQPLLPSTSTQLHPPPPPAPMVNFFDLLHETPARTSSVAGPSQISKVKKKKAEKAPYLWATNERAKIHSLEYLRNKGIESITGEIYCKYCQKLETISYNLEEKFSELKSFITMYKLEMRDRAPDLWSYPKPMKCSKCGKKAKPVIGNRKYKINWLFLLLGQTLGFCTLEQLKNFCKHSDTHKTGAKDRVLYLAYLGLCKMLEPNSNIFDWW